MADISEDDILHCSSGLLAQLLRDHTTGRDILWATHDYESLGDSLLLTRENLLYTFVDYYEARFGSTPDIQLLQDFAEIISWNLWQMDGLSCRIPQEKKDPQQSQTSLFDEAKRSPLPFASS